MAKPVHDWNYVPVQGYDISNAFGMAQGGINNAVAGIEKWMDVKSEIATGEALNALAQANDAVEVNNLLKEVQSNTWVDNKALGESSTKRKDRFFDEDITEQELAERLTAGAHSRKMAEGNLSLGWANHGLSANNSAVSNSIAMGRYNMDQAEYQRKLGLIGEDGLTDDERLDLLLKQQKLERGDADILKVKTDIASTLAGGGSGKGTTTKPESFKVSDFDKIENGYEEKKKIEGEARFMATLDQNDKINLGVARDQAFQNLNSLFPNKDAESQQTALMELENREKERASKQYREINNNQVDYLENVYKAQGRKDSFKMQEELAPLSPLIADTNLTKEDQQILYEAYSRYRKDGNAVDGSLLVQHVLNSAHNLSNGQEFLTGLKDRGYLVDAPVTNYWFSNDETAKAPASKMVWKEILNLYNEYSYNTNAKTNRTRQYRDTTSGKKGK